MSFNCPKSHFAVKVKCAQIIPVLAKNVGQAVFYLKVMCFNCPKKSLCIWATFVRKFVTKNFQKLSPNLVTLTEGWLIFQQKFKSKCMQ